MMGMEFPCYHLNCEPNPTQYRCANFHFLDPLLDLVMLFFVNSDNPMKFETDNDMFGKNICWPKGFLTYDLIRMAATGWLMN